MGGVCAVAIDGLGEDVTYSSVRLPAAQSRELIAGKAAIVNRGNFLLTNHNHLAMVLSMKCAGTNRNREEQPCKSN